MSQEPSFSGRYPLKQAAISKATAASHEIVPAVAGHSIRAISLLLVADSAVDVTFEDGGGTDRTGPMDCDTIITASSESGLFWTAKGEALNMLLGGAVQVSGVITYIEVAEAG